MIEWCNNKIHVMEIDCPDIETFTRVESDLSELLLWKGGKVFKKNFLSGNLQLIVKTCKCCKIKPNVSEIVEKNSCLVIPPKPSTGVGRSTGLWGSGKVITRNCSRTLTKLARSVFRRSESFPRRASGTLSSS